MLPARFELAISALRGQCPRPLDDGSIHGVEGVNLSLIGEVSSFGPNDVLIFSVHKLSRPNIIPNGGSSSARDPGANLTYGEGVNIPFFLSDGALMASRSNSELDVPHRQLVTISLKLSSFEDRPTVSVQISMNIQSGHRDQLPYSTISSLTSRIIG